MRALLDEAHISRITVADRILLHLMNFRISAGAITVPFDLTQDGIATVIGITRAHASVELKKMDKEGYLCIWKSHLPGCPSKRLSYVLTPKGFEKAGELSKMLKERGIAKDALLSPERCNPVQMWNSLCDEDREIMGMACVLRVGIPVTALPKMKYGTVPRDKAGLVSIPKTVATNFLAFANAESLKKWHAWAAEYWLDHGNCTERLFHLVCAGMNPEAGLCITVNRRLFAEDPTPDMLRTVLKLAGKTPYSTDVCILGITMAQDLGKPDVADELLAMMKDICPDEWAILKSVSLRMSGKYEEAAKLAESAFVSTSDPYAAAVASLAYSDMGNTDSAEEYSDIAMSAVNRTGDGEHLDEVFLAKARVAMMRGYASKAAGWAEKAARCAPPHRKKRACDILDALGCGAGATGHQ